MARPRSPTNLLALKGAFKANPARGRARAAEPLPEGDIGGPPDHLDDASKRTWCELVSLSHEGTLCRADRVFLEHTSRLLATMRSETSYSDARLMLRLESALAKLGLTPADRSRVSAKPKQKVNRFAEFQTDWNKPR